MFNADEPEPLSRDRDVRFRLPQAVLDLPQGELDDRVRVGGGQPETADFMRIGGCASFVRALLQVDLSTGASVTYGLWVAIDPSEQRRIYDLWWTDDYAFLEFDGQIANRIPPFGLLGVNVRARVRDAEETPYCQPGLDSTLAEVLARQWESNDVLPFLPDSSEHNCTHPFHI